MSKVMRTHIGITEWNGYYWCDSCGRKIPKVRTVDGMDFCPKCYQETFAETDKDKKIADLETKLAEKDKEIAELKKKCEELSDKEFEHFGDMKTYKNMWLAEQRKNKEIRHQVCEEIREKLKAHCDYTDEENIGWYIEQEKINKILNQIEQGESK